MLSGTLGSGISTFLYRLSIGCFPSEYIPAHIDEYEYSVDFDGSRSRMKFYDNSENSRNKVFRTLGLQNTRVFVLCYSHGLEKSNYELRTRWLPEIQSFLSEENFVVILGLRGDSWDSNKGI